MSDEEAVETLRSLGIDRLATHANRLVRMGQLTGEAALSLIVWPDQRDMRTYAQKEGIEQTVEEILKQAA